MSRYDCPDQAWELIEPLLPPQKIQGKSGRPYLPHRKIVNGIFWVLCSGASWRDLPERYGSWKTVYNRFNKWSKQEIINSIFNQLLQILEQRNLIDWSSVLLDGSNVRALKAAAGAKKKILMTYQIMG